MSFTYLDTRNSNYPFPSNPYIKFLDFGSGPSYYRTTCVTYNAKYKVGEKRPKPEGDFIPPTAYEYRDEQGARAAWDNPYLFWVEPKPPGIGRVEYTSRPRLSYPSKLWGVIYSYQCDAVEVGSRNKALSHLKSGKASLGLAFAERKKTASMFEECLLRSRNAVRNLKAGRLTAAMDEFGLNPKRGLKSNSKEWASLWLELQYGWMPTVNDVNTAVKLLAEKDAEDQKRYTLSSIGKFEITDSESKTVVIKGGTPFTSYSKQEVTLTEENFRRWYHKTRLDAYVDNSLLGDLSHFGFIDASAIAWELVPFSFLVDWSLPIGNYLSLLDASSGLAFRAGSKTLSTEFLSGTKNFSAKYPPTESFRPSSYRDFYTKREVIGSFPMPGLRLNRDPVSVTRVLNAVALTRLAFKKR